MLPFLVAIMVLGGYAWDHYHQMHGFDDGYADEHSVKDKLWDGDDALNDNSATGSGDDGNGWLANEIYGYPEDHGKLKLKNEAKLNTFIYFQRIILTNTQKLTVPGRQTIGNGRTQVSQ